MNTQREPRKLSFWLIASILINMLLIGALGGYFVRGGPSMDHADNSNHQRVNLMPDEATSADRQAVRGVMRGAFQAAKAERDASREARQALAAAIDTDPYDADAVQVAFADMRAAESAMQVAIHESLALNMSVLTLRQREGVIRGLRRGPRGRGNKRRGGDHRPPPPDNGLEPPR